MSLFGKILTLATLPVRVVAAPVKAAADLLSPNQGNVDGVVPDTLRYVLTGKQDADGNPTEGFCDFEEGE